MALDKFRETFVTWDKANKKVYQPLRVSGSDEKGRKLVVQVVNDGVIEDLSGTNLSLAWDAKNGETGLDPFTQLKPKEGIFELFYTNRMLQNIGVLRGNFSLNDATGRIVSDDFHITVFDKIDDSAAGSQAELSLLQQALTKVNQYDGKIAKVSSEVESARGTHPNLSQRLLLTDRQIADIGVNIKIFGAVGDGITDDTQAIQKTINYCFENDLTVFIPNGHFIVTKPIIIHEKLSLRGTGGIAAETYDNSQFKCVIHSKVSELFICPPENNTSGLFKTKLDVSAVMFMGEGKASTLFSKLEIVSSIVKECKFFNFGVVFRGSISDVTEIYNNRAVNIHKSFIQSMSTTDAAGMTDSYVHHNYLNGTGEGNTIMFDLAFGNYSSITHNFFDFCYVGIQMTPAGLSMDISNNRFDLCFNAIFLRGVTSSIISNNLITKSSKSDTSVFNSLSPSRKNEFLTNEWVGINLNENVNYCGFYNNISHRCDLLLRMTSYGLVGVKSSGNINTYPQGRTVYMRRSTDANNPLDGININIKEMNYKKVTELPVSAGWFETFEGNILIYKNKIIIFRDGKWYDYMGNIIT